MLAKSNVILSFQLCAKCCDQKPVAPPLCKHPPCTKDLNQNKNKRADHANQTICWIYCSACAPSVMLAKSNVILSFQLCANCCDQKPVTPPLCKHPPCTKELNQNKNERADHANQTICWIYCSACAPSVMLAKSNVILSFQLCANCCDQKPVTPPLCKHPPCTKELNQNKNKRADHANQTICWIYCSACAPSVMLAKSNVILSFQLCANCCDQKPVTPPLCKHPPCTKDLNQNKNKRADHANQTICWIYCSACAPSVMLAKSNVILSFQLCANCRGKKPVTPIHHHFASTRHAQKISIKTRTNGQIMQIRPSVGFTAPHVRPQSCWLSQMSSCHFNYVQIAATRNLLHHHFASTRRAQKNSIKTRTNGQIMQIRPSVGFTAPHVRPQSCWLSQMSSCHFNYVYTDCCGKNT